MADKTYPHRQPGDVKQVDLYEITSGGFGVFPEELLPKPGDEPATAREEPPPREPAEGAGGERP